MSSTSYQFPVAISQLSPGETSREAQNSRAIKWLIGQSAGPLVVVTPRKQVPSKVISQLLASATVTHLTWKGLTTGSLTGRRVLYAWPSRKHLNDLWGVEAKALAIIEWNESDTAEWIEDANPVRLLSGQTVDPQPVDEPAQQLDPLPNGVDGILEHIAMMAAGYSSGLKWNEEDKLKADMMNRPERWVPITVEQVRTKCRSLGMSPNDVDTIAEVLQRRKDGRRFNVQSSYRSFQFK